MHKKGLQVEWLNALNVYNVILHMKMNNNKNDNQLKVMRKLQTQNMSTDDWKRRKKSIFGREHKKQLQRDVTCWCYDNCYSREEIIRKCLMRMRQKENKS